MKRTNTGRMIEQQHARTERSTIRRLIEHSEAEVRRFFRRREADGKFARGGSDQDKIAKRSGRA